MKNKKNVQALLGLVVLAIWGAVAYNILNYSKGIESSPIFRVTEMSANSIELATTVDSYKLELNYPDPFTGKRGGAGSRIRQTHTVSAIKNLEADIPSLPKSVFPKIEYRGYLLHQKQIASVRIYINNQAHTAKLNETIGGLTIIEMARDSITVASQDNELKVVYRRKKPE